MSVIWLGSNGERRSHRKRAIMQWMTNSVLIIPLPLGRGQCSNQNEIVDQNGKALPYRPRCQAFSNCTKCPTKRENYCVFNKPASHSKWILWRCENKYLPVISKSDASSVDTARHIYPNSGLARGIRGGSLSIGVRALTHWERQLP